MQRTWKKCLMLSTIISVILGLIIPELIRYYRFTGFTPSNLEKQQMDINIYGLVKLMFLDFIFWFSVSFCSFIILGFLFSYFRKNASELK